MGGVGGWAGWASGAVIAALIGVVPAHAAVRQCAPRPTIAIGEDAASEAAARKQALERWVAAAAKIGGPPWSSWRLAVSRELSCQKRADGVIACRAVGLPCMIVQNPGMLPKVVPTVRPPKPQQDAAAPARLLGLEALGLEALGLMVLDRGV